MSIASSIASFAPAKAQQQQPPPSQPGRSRTASMLSAGSQQGSASNRAAATASSAAAAGRLGGLASSALSRRSSAAAAGAGALSHAQSRRSSQVSHRSLTEDPAQRPLAAQGRPSSLATLSSISPAAPAALQRRASVASSAAAAAVPLSRTASAAHSAAEAVSRPTPARGSVRSAASSAAAGPAPAPALQSAGSNRALQPPPQQNRVAASAASSSLLDATPSPSLAVLLQRPQPPAAAAAATSSSATATATASAAGTAAEPAVLPEEPKQGLSRRYLSEADVPSLHAAPSTSAATTTVDERVSQRMFPAEEGPAAMPPYLASAYRIADLGLVHDKAAAAAAAASAAEAEAAAAEAAADAAAADGPQPTSLQSELGAAQIIEKHMSDYVAQFRPPTKDALLELRKENNAAAAAAAAAAAGQAASADASSSITGDDQHGGDTQDDTAEEQEDSSAAAAAAAGADDAEVDAAEYELAARASLAVQGVNPFASPEQLPYAQRLANPYQMPFVVPIEGPPLGGLQDDDEAAAGEGEEETVDTRATGAGEEEEETAVSVEDHPSPVADDDGDDAGGNDTSEEEPEDANASPPPVVGRRVYEPPKAEELAAFVERCGSQAAQRYREDPTAALEIASASMVQDIARDLVEELNGLKASLFHLTGERDGLKSLVDDLRAQLAARIIPPSPPAPEAPPPPAAAAPREGHDGKLILNWALFQSQLREAQADMTRLRTQLHAQDAAADRAERAEAALAAAEAAVVQAALAYDSLADAREADVDALEGLNMGLRAEVNARVPRTDFDTLHETAQRERAAADEAASRAGLREAALEAELLGAQDLIRRVEEEARLREERLQALLLEGSEEQARLLRQLIASEQALLPELRERLVVQREAIAGLLKRAALLEAQVGQLAWEKEAAELLAEGTEEQRAALERELGELRAEHEGVLARLEQALSENREIPKLRGLLLDAQEQISTLVERMKANEEYILLHKDTVDQLRVAHKAEIERVEARVRDERRAEAGELLGRHCQATPQQRTTTTTLRSHTSYPGQGFHSPGVAAAHTSVSTAAAAHAAAAAAAATGMPAHASLPMSLSACSPLDAIHILHERFAGPGMAGAAAAPVPGYPRGVSPLRERLG